MIKMKQTKIELKYALLCISGEYHSVQAAKWQIKRMHTHKMFSFLKSK